MGNSSSNEDINPLNIPDGHFIRYGLNEGKNVMVFQTISRYQYNNTHYGYLTGYGYDLAFLIPQTKNSWSHLQRFDCQTLCLRKDCVYFYEKDLGYVCVDDSATMAELYKKYNINSSTESLKESMKDPPSINL